MRPSQAIPSEAASSRSYVVLVVLAIAYYAAAALGLRLAYLHPSATPVWAPTGIALAALLRWGSSVWPAIFVGAFIVNVVTEGNVATSAGIALGNTLEGVLGAHLVRRASRGVHPFDDARDVFRFVTLAGVLSTAVSATIGVSVLSTGGFAAWDRFPEIWLTWWLGDVAGALVVAPTLLTWAHDRKLRWSEDRSLELVGFVSVLLIVGQLVFGGIIPSWGAPIPLEFLVLPLLLWAGVRFTPREAATTMLVISGIAVRGTLQGLGPFTRVGTNDSLLLMQAFMVVSAASTLVLAAVVAERRKATVELLRRSERDGLTGLANYRTLYEVLARETHRSGRTERAFALLLMDLDGLKAINDRLGHLTGNRAICRVAAAMLAGCRAVDTPARFGGDEFAVVLPETELEEAWTVAHRIQERVETGEEPALALSVGIALYPLDGATPEGLMEAADRMLYATKRAGRDRSDRPKAETDILKP